MSLANLGRVLWWAWRLRRVGLDELVGQLDRFAPVSSEDGPALGSAERCWPWVSGVRVVARLAGGFGGPMREGALMALVLRRLGVPAFLVIGHEPVPVVAGRRRLVVWVQVGATVVTGVRPAWLYPELVRYPAPSTTLSPAAALPAAGVPAGGAG